MNGEVVYEGDATDLKLKHRRKRILEIVFIIGFDILLLVLLFSFLEWYAIPLYFLGILLFFPSPYVVIPDKYAITKDGMIHVGKRTFQLKKKHRVSVNTKDEFISISASFGHELLRLYTSELDRVNMLLKTILEGKTRFQNTKAPEYTN